jgi:hypothetical protein
VFSQILTEGRDLDSEIFKFAHFKPNRRCLASLQLLANPTTYEFPQEIPGIAICRAMQSISACGNFSSGIPETGLQFRPETTYRNFTTQ